MANTLRYDCFAHTLGHRAVTPPRYGCRHDDVLRCCDNICLRQARYALITPLLRHAIDYVADELA